MKHMVRWLPAIGALMLAWPQGAAAQQLTPDRTDNVVDEIVAFEQDIQTATASGTIARKASSHLNSRARAIRAMFNKNSRDGLSLAEAQLLRERIDYLRNRYGLPDRRGDQF